MEVMLFFKLLESKTMYEELDAVLFINRLEHTYLK